MTKIGIDGRFAIWQTRGTGRYVRELLYYLSLIDKENEYIIYVDREDKYNIIPKVPNFHLKILSPSFWPIYEQFSLVKAITEDKLDILHLPCSTGPLFIPVNVKVVTTIFDVVFLKKNNPKAHTLYQKMGKIYRKFIVPFVARRSLKIICASRAQGNDIIKLLNIPSNKVNVVYLGINEFLKKNDTIKDSINLLWNDLKVEYEIFDKPFLFTVGGTAPVKLTLHMIKTFQNYITKFNRMDIKLIVSGLGGEKNTYLHKYVNENNLSSNVIFTDYLEDKKLIIFYHKASIFIYFLLSNGFELPIIEAMSCGTPCIFSDTQPIPELYGGYGIVVNHFDESEVHNAIQLLLTNKNKIEEYTKKSIERANFFSSLKMATETLKIYKEVYDN